MSTSANTPFIQVQQLGKQYPTQETPTLKDISFTVAAGDFVALMGPSGCGKSTLLNLIGAMDTATEGDILINQISLTQQTDAQLTQLRRETMGFVFQFFNLLNTLTVAENIALPLELLGQDSPDVIQDKVNKLLSAVQLEYRAHFYPAQISGGEMQRVAIARALIHQPKLILADEPTGNLDSETGNDVLTLLKTLCKEQGQTVIMATHSHEAAQNFADYTLPMRDGHLINHAVV